MGSPIWNISRLARDSVGSCGVGLGQGRARDSLIELVNVVALHIEKSVAGISRRSRCTSEVLVARGPGAQQVSRQLDAVSRDLLLIVVRCSVSPGAPSGRMLMISGDR